MNEKSKSYRLLLMAFVLLLVTLALVAQKKLCARDPVDPHTLRCADLCYGSEGLTSDSSRFDSYHCLRLKMGQSGYFINLIDEVFPWIVGGCNLHAMHCCYVSLDNHVYGTDEAVSFWNFVFQVQDIARSGAKNDYERLLSRFASVDRGHARILTSDIEKYLSASVGITKDKRGILLLLKAATLERAGEKHRMTVLYSEILRDETLPGYIRYVALLSRWVDDFNNKHYKEALRDLDATPWQPTGPMKYDCEALKKMTQAEIQRKPTKSKSSTK